MLGLRLENPSPGDIVRVRSTIQTAPAVAHGRPGPWMSHPGSGGGTAGEAAGRGERCACVSAEGGAPCPRGDKETRSTPESLGYLHSR